MRHALSSRERHDTFAPAGTIFHKMSSYVRPATSGEAGSISSAPDGICPYVTGGRIMFDASVAVPDRSGALTPHMSSASSSTSTSTTAQRGSHEKTTFEPLTVAVALTEVVVASQPVSGPAPLSSAQAAIASMAGTASN